MISLKKVYRILKNNLKYLNGSILYTKDGIELTINFRVNADYKQVVDIYTNTDKDIRWFAHHQPISSVYDKFYYKEHYLIKRIFTL